MQLDFKKLDGLVAAVIQDWKTNEVLMVGFMNEESFRRRPSKPETPCSIAARAISCG